MDIVDRLFAVDVLKGLCADAAEEIQRLRKKVEEEGRRRGSQTIRADAAEAERDRLRAEVAYLQKEIGECSGGYQTLEKEVAALKFACDALKKGQPDPDAAVRDERDRLRELLRDARTVMAFEHVLKPDYGWNEMVDRIDAALGKEER